MAKRMRMTDDDILDLFDSSGDEMDVDQSDEDVDFDPETTENESDTSSLHELLSSGDEDMDVSGVGDADTSAGRISDDAESEWKVMVTTLVRMPMLQAMGLFGDLIYQQIVIY